MWQLLLALFGPIAVPHAAKPSCAVTAAHIVDVALGSLDKKVADYPDTGPATILRLAQQCQTETWSAAELACLNRSTTIGQVHVCKPSPAEAPARMPKLSNTTDTSCATIGDHMGKLMQVSSSGLGQDSVAASIVVDMSKLGENLRAECARAAWSTNLRRCYAGATRYLDTIPCNQAYRD
ncbi:MAG TPA: hypothetical protein VGM39_06745 [Kofleriaceae bacterium]|jgi:hypothetical protein